MNKDMNEDEYEKNRQVSYNKDKDNMDLRDSMALEMVSILNRESQAFTPKLNDEIYTLIKDSMLGDDEHEIP